jgi:hypothetical protein
LLILDWACRISPAIGASIFVAIGLIAIILWRGGTIETVKIPGIFDVKLKEPIVFSGRPLLLYLSVAAFVAAVGLASLQQFHGCERCDGMPGETAWIYGGQFDRATGNFALGPFLSSTETGIAPQAVQAGSRITLTEPRKTMILDYPTLGLVRAMDSPFRRDGKIAYTCKTFPSGQQLYVAAKEINGPSPDVQHLWVRVRVTPPGG